MSERNLILIQLEKIGIDYELKDYIQLKIENLGHKFTNDLNPCELLDLYDSVLCKIYR